jgi:arylsulfatase
MGCRPVVPWFSFAQKKMGGARDKQMRSMRRKYRGFIMYQFLAITQAGCRRLFPRHLLHRITTLAFSASLAVIPQLLFTTRLKAKSSDRPNILLIMADDLGYSDLGCYGGEINTPNLDALADNGLRFTQFYNTARCWPTRASLLTGYYPQSVRRDAVPDVPSGGRGKRPAWAPLLCEPLRAAGYRTYHTGKWHLDGMPIASGFDRSYYLKDQHRFFNPTLHWKDDVKLPPVPKGTDFYGTIALGDHAVECLKEHATSHAHKPFFHYLAFTAPHFPLHALPEDIDHYRETYRVGWKTIRQARWQRIQSMGLVASELSEVMREVGPPYDFPDAIKQLGSGEVNRPLDWQSLSDEQKEFQATKMAIHAAMIDCMDRQIGRVLDQLRSMNQFDNTAIFFLSDNGASAEIMVRGDGHDPSAPMGSWASHLCLGPGWSTASNTPFRYHKTWTHEGGTATPLIVHWKAGIESKGQLRSHPSHVIDVWPTVTQLAGITDPDDESPRKPGRSLVSGFARDAPAQRTLWWSHEGNRALRRGDWKISAAGKTGPWELYRMDRDRTETTDLADSNPQKLTELSGIWVQMNDRHTEMALADRSSRPQ